MSTSKVRTAIFPVAGLGTRFLPATKVTPKELLPVIDTPLIQFAINEARDAGVERMVFVSHPSKGAIERYVLDDSDLRDTLRERGKNRIAQELQENALGDADADVVFTIQDKPLGLGHAVLCARPHVLPGPVAVILPDDLILSQVGCLSEMISAYDPTLAGHLVASMDVSRDETDRYGVLSVTRRVGTLSLADGMVEKPAPGKAPSTTAVVGRYILDESIFEDLETQGPGAGDEIQLTDAIARGIGRVGLAGYSFSGRRFDCGSKHGMLAATLCIAQGDPVYRSVLDDFTGGRVVGAAA